MLLSARHAPLLTCGIFCACAHLDAKVREPLEEMPAQFAASTNEGVPLEARWWESFGDPGLNQAVALAFENSPTLLMAWERLAQAELSAHLAGASQLPEADLRRPGFNLTTV